MVQPHKLFGRLGNTMFQMAYIYAQMKRGVIPDIYVQDPQYFDEYRNDIRQLFGQGIGKLDMVAIHVRRGDYVKNPFYVDLMETDYYQKAMDMFQGEDFIVFSDDIEWCKQQSIFKDCEFVQGDEIEDMNKMASCKGIIMANSSYSFWCAYLSYYIDPNKKGRRSIFGWHIKINDGDDLYMAKPIESILDISKFYRDIRDILPATPAKLKTIGFEYE